MKKNILRILFLFPVLCCQAQEDSTAFTARLVNDEFKVFLHISFHKQDIEVPGQEIYGRLPGYLGRERYTFVWPIVSADVNENIATIAMVNDYGSEDLTATLTRDNDSIYTLKQTGGSPLKVPNNGKWLKLPRVIKFKRK